MTLDRSRAIYFLDLNFTSRTLIVGGMIDKIRRAKICIDKTIKDLMKEHVVVAARARCYVFNLTIQCKTCFFGAAVSRSMVAQPPLAGQLRGVTLTSHPLFKPSRGPRCTPGSFHPPGIQQLVHTTHSFTLITPHRGRGSVATSSPGSWTCPPQTHSGGGHCRWPATQVVGGVSPSASPLHKHCCW